MNKYESVVIINPTVDEEGMKALISKFTDLISLWCKKILRRILCSILFRS